MSRHWDRWICIGSQ